MKPEELKELLSDKPGAIVWEFSGGECLSMLEFSDLRPGIIVEISGPRADASFASAIEHYLSLSVDALDDSWCSLQEDWLFGVDQGECVEADLKALAEKLCAGFGGGYKRISDQFLVGEEHIAILREHMEMSK